MAYKVAKSGRVFNYFPFPQQRDIIIKHFRLDENQAKELREKYGKTLFNKNTGKMEFEITDEQGFKKNMLKRILSGHEGFITDEDDPSLIRLLTFDEFAEVAATLPMWMLSELTTRALGLNPDSDMDNLIVQFEEGSKKY